MLCSNCGGKLTVIESAQHPHTDGVKVYRVRKCQKCKQKYTSFEIIKGAKMDDGYIHNASMKF